MIVLMLAGCVAANSDVIKTDLLFPGTYRQFIPVWEKGDVRDLLTFQ